MSIPDPTGWVRPEQAAGETRGSHPSAAGPRDLPERFGPYRVKSKLGAGGMGSVYLVENLDLMRDEALKVPHFDPAETSGSRERFLREARAAARLDHPNLCTVYHAGVIDGVYFLTMRYLKGKPLSHFAGKPIPVPRAVEIVLALANALQYAHDQGVVHRDLKPSNVMLCPGQGPVVLDFGLAKQAVADDHLTKSGAFLGTPSYVPPEQLKGELHLIGPPTDVYSLGVILFELLTGRLPFTGTAAEVVGQLLYQPAPAPSTILGGIDPGLDAVCEQALAKLPDYRFPTMQAFAAALRDHQHAAGLTQPSAPPRPLMPTRDLPPDEATQRHRPAPPPPPPPASVKTTCPQCNARFAIKGGSQARRAFHCPSCGAAVTVAPGEASPVLDVLPVEDRPRPRPPAERTRRSEPPARPIRKGLPVGMLLAGGVLGVVVVAAVAVGVWMFVGGGGKANPWVGPGDQRREAEALYRDGMQAAAGIGRDVDEAQALALFRQAGDKGHVVAKGKAGLALILGAGTEKNENEGHRLLADSFAAVRRQADAGDADAQALYGLMLTHGAGVPRDQAAALDWYRRAADQGHAHAAYDLGRSHELGWGVAKDHGQAAASYRKAADKGHVMALADLGYLHEAGTGVEKDSNRAYDYYQRAAEKGDPHAMCNLGSMYDRGVVVARDEAKAVDWYTKAVAKRYGRAMFLLGTMYENGRGVPADAAEALKWYGRAAGRNDPDGQRNERRLRLVQQLVGRWERAGNTLTLTRDRFTHSEDYDYSLTIDAEATPVTYDIRGIGKLNVGLDFAGILRVEGETLTLAYAGNGNPRPTTFDMAGANVETYTRAR